MSELLTDDELCDHDYPEREGRCVSCWAGLSGDAKLIDELRAENARLRAALARIGRENCRCGCRRLANLALVAHQDAALASVRGDA